MLQPVVLARARASVAIKVRRMLSLLRRRPLFLRLYLAGALSLVGDWLSLVAVSLLAAASDDGPTTLAVVFAAHALPGALAASLAGPFADRFDRRKVLLAAHLVQAGLTLLMVAAAARAEVGLLSLFVLVRSGVAALVSPAEAGALRRVVAPHELSAANTLIASTWSVAFVLGMAAGGAIAMLGAAWAIGIDALSFVVAAALVAGLPKMPVDRGEEATSTALAALRAAPGDMLSAVRHARAKPSLARAVLSKVPIGLGAGAAWVTLNLVAGSARPFGVAALSLGALQALRGAGTGLGPLAAQALIDRGVRPSAVGHLAAASALGAMLLLPHASSALPLSLVAIAWGAGVGTNWVLSTSTMQRESSDAMIGRLTALDELMATTAMVLSALAGGSLLSAGVTPAAVVASSSTLGALSWAALLLLRPPVRGLSCKLARPR